MKNLWLFGIIGLSILVVNTVTAGHGSGWPGHHRGCFIETAAGDDSVESEANTPTQNDTDENFLAYHGSGSGYGNHGYYYGGHNSHHHGGHHCFISTASDNSWFEKILDFIWRPRS
jgi:hypothetical protein